MEPSIRILIADDDPRACAGLRAFFTTWPGCLVVAEAADGQEAVDRVAWAQPDVVLLDLRMPVMDGLAAAKAIRMRWPGIKIVILTLDGSQRASALAAGADAYLQKGDSPEQLVGTIRRLATPVRGQPGYLPVRPH